jgi:hypothetical protein
MTQRHQILIAINVALAAAYSLAVHGFHGMLFLVVAVMGIAGGYWLAVALISGIKKLCGYPLVNVTSATIVFSALLAFSAVGIWGIPLLRPWIYS